MNLYLIRHGESVGNKLGKIQGCMDFPLSDLGQVQIAKLAEYFKDKKLNYIYSSDLTRAYESANAIAKVKNMTVHTWDKVREVNLGPFQGLTRDEIYRKFPKTKERTILTSGIEGTETIDELTERCRYLVEQLKLAHSNDYVAVVSHGGFISIFLMYIMFGENWSVQHRPFRIDNTSITHIEWTSTGKPLLHYINRNNHLELINKQEKRFGLL